MRNLADAEIDFIRDDIRRRGVFTESLQENLLDHLCCFIEEQPEDRPFAEVYGQALEAFGHNGLQQVQDETLFLINHPHLTTMKKLMYITGATGSILLVGGAFFKQHHWPGANVMLLVGIGLLALLFAPSLFYLRFKEASETKTKVLSVFALVTAIVMLSGALFKLLHWPGAHVIAMSGFVLFFAVFLPLYLINGIRNPVTRFSSLANGTLLASTGGILLLLTFQQPSHAVTTSFETIHQNEDQLFHTLEKEWEAKAASKPIECDNWLKEFRSSCKGAIDALPENGEFPDPVGMGRVISDEDLERLQAKINTAVDELNLRMRQEKAQDWHWTDVPAPKLQIGTLGSVRFQVLQLECRVYTQALSL